jgi:hypothetical protein
MSGTPVDNTPRDSTDGGFGGNRAKGEAGLERQVAGEGSSPDRGAEPELGGGPETVGTDVGSSSAREEGGSDASTKAKKRKKRDRQGKKGKGKGTPTVGSSRGIETMFRATYRVHMDLTALADSKANIMISINGLILSIILASVAPKIDSNNWLLIPTTIVLLSCLGAIIFAVLSARPRINASTITLDDVRSGRENLLFFGNYSRLDEDDFVRGMTDLAQNPDLLYTNMMRDVYGIGRVLNRKFELLRKSYMVFMYGLTVSVLAFIFVFVMQAISPTV